MLLLLAVPVVDEAVAEAVMGVEAVVAVMVGAGAVDATPATRLGVAMAAAAVMTWLILLLVDFGEGRRGSLALNLQLANRRRQQLLASLARR